MTINAGNSEQKVSKEILEKWEDVIDGKGDWEEFVETCPKIKTEGWLQNECSNGGSEQ